MNTGLRLGVTLFALFVSSAFSQTEGTFTNPLVVSGADPQLSVFGGAYYLTYTTGGDVRVRRAESLGALKGADETILWSDTDAGRCCHVWAPELHRLEHPDGWRWYVYYTAGPAECCAEQRMHVLESDGDDPLGPYHYKGRLYDPEHDFWAIDPTVFKAAGQPYVVWSGTPRDAMPFEKPQHLYIARLENPWTMAGPRVEIARPEYAWEKVEGEVNEGPAVLRRNGRVFLSFSGSGCWTDDYAVGLMVAGETSDLLAPESWQKMPEPLLTRLDEHNVFGPGHNSFFKSPDSAEDWLIYHANPYAGLGCGGVRAPRAQKVTWNEDGLPVFGQPAPLGEPVALPSGDRAKR